MFHSLVDRLIPRPRPTRPRRAAPRRSRLAVEQLDDRLTPAAMLAVGDATVVEGSGGVRNAVVTVTLTEPHGNSVAVNYRTSDGSASAGGDYGAVSGKLTFAKNETSKSILVPVTGDRVPESYEDFVVQLSNPKGAKIADGTGIVSVTDDEPRVWINDVSAPEANSGPTPLTFQVSLSAAYNLPVTIDFATADGSAVAGVDYSAGSGRLTFDPGQTTQPVTVMVNGSPLAEPNKTFLVNLSTPDSYAEISRGVGVGTVIDGQPRIYISDSYNYGESTFTFTVSLSAISNETVTVNYETVDGTAIAGVDYVAKAGPLTFAPGVTSQTIAVDVLDPTSVPDKYFYVRLSGASTNALISNVQASGIWYYDPGYSDGGGWWYDPWYGYY